MLDAAGNVLGSLTENGFHRYGSYFIRGEAESEQTALYVADSWRVNDRLTIDVGYRKQWYDQTGVRHQVETRDLGDPTTTAATTRSAHDAGGSALAAALRR